MRAEGSLSVQASRENMWSRLSDPHELEQALPAVEEVEVSDGDSFSVLLAPSTALGETPLWVDVRVAERREGEHVRLVCRGRGGEYDASLAVDIHLDGDRDADGCEVRWSAEASFNGVWSALGQRVLPAILASQVERVLRAASDG
jgi:carbon monoxide dehydrogenase subunit G